MKKILFVCLGNICRSPAQEYVSRELAKEKGFVFTSCGISDWHVGEDMDRPMRLALERKGYKVSRHRAKVMQKEFFKEFDYIFGATSEVCHFLSSQANGESEKKKIYLASHFSQKYQGEEIPDPYMKEDRDFDAVLEMIEEIAKETLDRLSSSE